MRVVVLGAGVIGVTSAWYLARAGHEVTVVDRQPQPGLETSFANGSQISVCHAEPWANPAVFTKLLRWLGREDAPLLWRFRLDPAQWRWGLHFLAQCGPRRTRQNIEALVALGLHSRACLQTLRQELGLEYDQLEKGILHFYTDIREFEHAVPQAELMTRLGCRRQVVSSAECLALEPALAHIAPRIVGGTYTADDESGDARMFSQALARHCAELGVRFRFDTVVRGLSAQGGRIDGVLLAEGASLQADAYVVALGSYAPLLVAPLGLSLPIYPAKGYSITIPLADDAQAPTVSLTDDGYKLVYSRLGQRLRVAGTAEFCGYDTSLNRARLEALKARTREVFPQIEPAGEVEEWAGLRPATPGNVPLVGATRYANLFLNAGHGTLGWTLACGSSQLLADLVSGRPPALDPTRYRP
ncbi:D-amino acid dehydrogenase [Denitratisoma sp. agr-D3]